MHLKEKENWFWMPCTLWLQLFNEIMACDDGYQEPVSTVCMMSSMIN